MLNEGSGVAVNLVLSLCDMGEGEVVKTEGFDLPLPDLGEVDALGTCNGVDELFSGTLGNNLK